MEQSTSVLEGVQTPNLSTTSGKIHHLQLQLIPDAMHLFSISPLRAANLDEKAECAKTPE